jgi:hypothetical protein
MLSVLFAIPGRFPRGFKRIIMIVAPRRGRIMPGNTAAPAQEANVTPLPKGVEAGFTDRIGE